MSLESQAVNFGSRVLWPVGCPKPKEGVRDVNKYVHNWLSEGKNNFFSRRNTGTYASAGITLASIAAFFKSDGKAKKALFGILGGIGLAATTFFNECCYGSKSMNFIYNKFLLWPKKKMKGTPEEAGINNYDKVELPVGEKDKIKGIYVPSKENPSTKKTILYLSGRKHNVSWCYDSIKTLSEKTGANILCVDYRGFGESTGNADFDNTMEDVLAMYDHLVQERGLDGEDITVIGHSLGGAYATKLAKERKVNALVRASTISNTVDVSKDNTPRFIHKLLDMILEERFDSEQDIAGVQTEKVLTIHTEDDKIVPVERARKLHEKFEHAEFMLVPGDHNNYAKNLGDKEIAKLKELIFNGSLVGA